MTRWGYDLVELDIDRWDDRKALAVVHLDLARLGVEGWEAIGRITLGPW
jgi:hypothetical protein